MAEDGEDTFLLDLRGVVKVFSSWVATGVVADSEVGFSSALFLLASGGPDGEAAAAADDEEEDIDIELVAAPIAFSPKPPRESRESSTLGICKQLGACEFARECFPSVPALASRFQRRTKT